MKTITYYIVDVFASKKYEGNQLAVFVDLENELSDPEMQQMAREINFAESTFIKKDLGEGHFVVRIFTPEHEIPFAGHPSLGTSFIICKFLLQEPRHKLTLELAHADIAITLENPHSPEESIFYMRQTQPVFGEGYTKELVTKQLGIPLEALQPDLPVTEISTGLPYVIIPLRNLQSIEDLSLSYASLTNFSKSIHRHKSNSSDGRSTSLFFFTNQTYDPANSYNARMFLIENEKLSEDAATGSANGCLLAYLLKHEVSQIKAIVEQGYQMGRKSSIYLDGEVKNETYRINVGGFSKLISQGTWYV